MLALTTAFQSLEETMKTSFNLTVKMLQEVMKLLVTHFLVLKFYLQRLQHQNLLLLMLETNIWIVLLETIQLQTLSMVLTQHLGIVINKHSNLKKTSITDLHTQFISTLYIKFKNIKFTLTTLLTTLLNTLTSQKHTMKLMKVAQLLNLMTQSH